MKNFALILSVTALVSAAAVHGEDPCDLKPFPDARSNKRPNAWSYLAEVNNCYNFRYDGDREKIGTVNSFASHKECESNCKKSDPCAMKPFSFSISKNSTNKIQYWTYKAKNNECVQYYGFYMGNENRFSSLDDCESKCKKYNRCVMDPLSVEGSEVLYFEVKDPLWAYNANTKECFQYSLTKFDYNALGFETSEECERTCKK